MSIDSYIFYQFNQWALKWQWLDALAIFFAEYFGYLLLFSLLIFLLIYWKRHWLMVVRIFLSAIFARFIIVEIIRFFWYRPRPFVGNSVNLLLDHSANGSFPSGHAAFYFAFATVVFFCNKKIGTLLFLFAFLISVFRVFAGIHWPSDILAGALIGIFSGWLVNKISKRFLKRSPF